MTQELERADRSLFFLGVLLGSILLSWRALWVQRQGLCTGEEPDVFPMRLTASVLVVLSLGFFFCLALREQLEAAGTEGEDAAAVNVLASLLVLLAALQRLGELLKENKRPAEAGLFDKKGERA